MIDYNHGAGGFSDRINHLIDAGLVGEHEREQHCRQTGARIGAGRIGVPCARALQYAYAQAPKDEDRGPTPRTLRIFAIGHALETLAARCLQDAGFELYTTDSKGEQFGFSVAGGRICGWCDGIFASGPEGALPGYPALWECKSMKAEHWRTCVQRGVAAAQPIYAAQIAIYQAYMDPEIPGLAVNPALFMAINKDTAELHFELVSFDADLAQRLSDRAVRIIQATEAGELLPRIATDREYFECRFCDWQDRCWKTADHG